MLLHATLQSTMLLLPYLRRFLAAISQHLHHRFDSSSILQSPQTQVAKQMSSKLKQISGFDTSIPVFDFRFFKLGSISNFWISELLVNVTKHVLQPKYEILTAEEKKHLLRKYKLEDNKIC
ncbi:uncharacterized protein LOC133725026 isoform X1 [Rosa rugosa]|uniref:uncharacterized protein LOC133725026 isoform X1 n=1 Tax=Rosa rugosa TaxID=74645 RepID=UPI002B415E04|nr:uncharacterized protein LOC133725026 isoform X1 [Rosa rugosa]